MFRDNIVVIDGVVIRERCIVMPEVLQQQVPKQLHVNHMSTGKTKLLAYKSVYWIDMNEGIENHKKLFYMP